MTAPLTPPDCDLKDFAYMPLDVARLRQSELASDETPEACWAAVLLWCASWHEVPAGSIPDNDQWQAKQAGYVARGKIDKAWDSVKAGALRGFVLCDDGRLYHPVVAEKARESWESKQRHAYGKMCERLRKLNKARAENGAEVLPVPSFDQWISGGKVDPLPPESDPSSAGIPPEKPLKGKGEGEGIDKKPSVSGSAGKPPRKPASARRVPADFSVTPDMEVWAGENAPLIDWRRETEKFRDWEFKTPRTDWPATWRTWMRKAQESAAERGHGPGSSAPLMAGVI